MIAAIYASLAVVFVLLFILERVFPDQSLPFNRRWFIRALVMNMVQLGLMLLFALWLNPWLGQYALFSIGESWPPILGGMAAAILSSFFQYGWHRAEHASDFLWRTFHQLHHSPSRIDILATDYTHPLDYIVYTLFNSFAAIVLLGLNAEGIAWSVFVYGVNNYYAHCNIRSPRWLGLVVQRPEMHRVHHKLGHHAQNYGFPVWDVMFGTFCNPDRADFEVGFGGDREHQVAAMLAGKDVNA
ncbi:sterol desaturase/sphingolipid hydroxylase (fatty acid hydroxylase superfamily) [Luteibacter sp. Sphag1AF]|uniref:sterol desaturase family protein n=1 Tax=Luteibacter sp. Sphag1AF TaxID=2587031 RepID=UPI00161C8D1F|nr:sterol desaturase family protein [Luteibacter sp. Sphag1AF]MBB3228875.1 sterol desaturase/sphingolipid hydroxylase (fatty acid hydroxylase superfamily) [Luteibacter sp. Sphag1AF]